MNHINEKIAYRKQAIHLKKRNVSNELSHLKQALGLPNIGLKTMGGLLLGFMLMPHKGRVLKLALKAFTIATTVKQLLELVPDKTQRRTTKRVSLARKDNVTHIHRRTK